MAKKKNQKLDAKEFFLNCVKYGNRKNLTEILNGW